MATKKSNKLTSSNLKQIHSKTFTSKIIHIDIEGTIYDVKVDERFKISKIQTLISELIEKQKYFTDIEEVFSIINFVPFLIIKYFSDIDVAKVEDFSEQLRVFEIMIDLGVAEKILESMPETEMQKINTYIAKATDNVKKLTSDKDAMQEIEGLFADLKDEYPELEEVESSESEETTNEWYW